MMGEDQRISEVSGDKQADETRTRLADQLEAAKSEIEHRIAELKRTQHEGELSDAIAQLDAQLTRLDSALQTIHTAPLAGLMSVNLSAHNTLSTVNQSTIAATSRAAFESGLHYAEVNIDRMIAMDANDIAALQSYHDAQAHQFETYERQSANHIERLAAVNGVDITGYRTTREQLLADRAEAERQGHRTEQFRYDALLAHNNTAGLLLTDAPQSDIDEARAKAAAARERYLKEKDIEAIRAGRAAGLSGDQLKAYVAQNRETAGAELDAEIARNAKAAGLSPEQVQQLALEETRHVTQEQHAANDLASRSPASQQFSVVSPKSQSEHEATVREQLDTAIAQTPAMKTTLQFAAADPAEAKDPAKVSVLTEATTSPANQR